MCKQAFTINVIVLVSITFGLFLTEASRDRMGMEPILPVTFGTMLNFDSDFGGHSDSDITCKQSLMNLRN